ncbi:ROK family protein [Caloramator sp. Dgby_cultured_2]|uniref:ROK family protein n=1 Tax=Caloramator sp. Dgby_cultured_2 TaxID=3029174 RepID=UPI00237DE86E|nr:ROK family protein [Caloramator sp. Dgby_cultured_2]WDU84436.1 ROK family protein [Caloramator sp. Dgby_cultured_2]
MDAVKKAGFYLGLGISNLINIFNPSLIVIGGDLIDINDLFFDELLLSAKNYSLQELFQNVNIKRTQTGKDAITKGAALLVLDNLFDSIQKEVIS